ncbi:Hypothetical predicted protein [Mytilus galloprovincialis]|uniref:Uncharacterized protein n=1 Tax=Mytilus galloprovincialis TaxID=29158 RepID=A0A8B6EFN7_MYTGA|nr:Hypothetical predicted protein [Mytilus galloprovincialis]
MIQNKPDIGQQGRFSAKMNHTEKDELSPELYHFLCNIVGSKDVVKARRNIFKVLDFVKSYDRRFTFISSGSKAEGLDLEGSDYDSMLVYDAFRVYENIPH